jgi:predicted RND superfamily exporter protein
VSGVLERAGLSVLRRPKLVAAGAVAVTALCVLLLFRLRIDPNVEHLLPPDDPTLHLTRQLQGDSPPTRVLFVILRADDPRHLEEAVPRAADALRASPFLTQVAATRQDFGGARVPWIERSMIYFLPEDLLKRIEARLTPPERTAELEGLQRRMAEDPLAGKPTALADPLGLRWIFDEIGDRMADRFPAKLRSGSPYLIVQQPAVAFLKALGREESPNTPFAVGLVEDARSRLERATAGKNVRVELAGSYVSAMTQAAALRRDMIVEITVSTFAVMLFVWWFARNLFAAHLVFVPVVLATAGSLAAGGLVFGPLTPIVVSAAAILIAQGIDFPVHFFVRYRKERASADLESALHRAQVGMARPFVGIAATTLAAFLALLVSRFPGIRQFGFVLAVGIVLCLVAALILFPILLMPIDRRIRPASERIPWVVRGAEAILRTKWRRPLAWALIVIGAASWGWVAHRGVRMDLDLRNAMAPGDPGRAALEGLERDLGASLIPVYALVDGSMSADDLRSRVAALRIGGSIAGGDGPQELYPSSAARERVEEFRRRTRGWKDATLAELSRLGFRPDPFRPALDNLEKRIEAPAPSSADLERPEYAALRRSMQSEGRHVVALFPTRSLWDPGTRAEFDHAVRARLGAEVPLFSPYHLPDHYSDVLNSDLTRVVILTAAGIAFLTLASVGSFRDGLFALVPVVLATGMTLALAVFLGGRINVINMAAIPIILAVGVDGGIHFMVRFRETESRDPAATIREVGPGIWGSAATTLLGFGSIASSVTPGMASMGYFVVAGTVTSLLASLFLLPGLLKARHLPPV